MTCQPGPDVNAAWREFTSKTVGRTNDSDEALVKPLVDKMWEDLQEATAYLKGRHS